MIEFINKGGGGAGSTFNGGEITNPLIINGAFTDYGSLTESSLILFTSGGDVWVGAHNGTLRQKIEFQANEYEFETGQTGNRRYVIIDENGINGVFIQKTGSANYIGDEIPSVIGTTTLVVGVNSGVTNNVGANKNILYGIDVAPSLPTATSERNVLIGYDIFSGLTSGTDRNVVIGSNLPMPSVANASYNIIIGEDCLHDVSTLTNATVIGRYSVRNATNLNSTVVIGNAAGNEATSSLTNSILLGYGVSCPTSASYYMNIGGLMHADLENKILKIGGSAGKPSGSAILELASTTQGFLPPRMTATQRNAISSPDEGLIVHDLTNNKPDFFDGTVWKAFVSTDVSTFTVGSIPFATAAHHINDDNANLFWDNTNKRFGIGTNTIPHGGIGRAKFAVDGANASVNGPHIQITTDADNYPVFQHMNWRHDDISLVFDAYYDGAWKSSDVGSNFRIFKNGDRLRLQYDNGISQGGAVTWNTGVALDATGMVSLYNELEVLGNVGFYGTTPIAQQTGVAVTEAAIHAALVNLGLITA